MLQSESAIQQDIITAGLCLMVADLQCKVPVRLTHLENSDTLDTRALDGLKISSPARPKKRFGPARYTAEKCRPGPLNEKPSPARPGPARPDPVSRPTADTNQNTILQCMLNIINSPTGEARVRSGDIKGVGTAGATGTLAPAMLKPRG